jgi:hypothetical protein
MAKGKKSDSRDQGPEKTAGESRILKRLSERAENYRREMRTEDLEIYESERGKTTAGRQGDAHDRMASTSVVRPDPASKAGKKIQDFDKDPHDRDPHDRDPGNFSRDNFSRDNFSRSG